MKQTYYLIEVYQYSEISDDYEFVGYYTRIYIVKGGKYCGFDANPEYEYVTRFKTLKAAQNHIDKVLEETHFGGETNEILYEFKVVAMELNDLKDNDKVTISRESRQQAVDIIKSCIPKDAIYQAYTDYCLDNNLDDNDAQNVLNALNHIYNQILKIL